MMDDLPKSVQVHADQTERYYLTAASWDTGYGPSYEIGIRSKSSGDFTLIQSGWNERSIFKALNAVKMMLNDGYTPAECREVFP